MSTPNSHNYKSGDRLSERGGQACFRVPYCGVDASQVEMCLSLLDTLPVLHHLDKLTHTQVFCLPPFFWLSQSYLFCETQVFTSRSHFLSSKKPLLAVHLVAVTWIVCECDHVSPFFGLFPFLSYSPLIFFFSFFSFLLHSSHLLFSPFSVVVPFNWEAPMSCISI